MRAFAMRQITVYSLFDCVAGPLVLGVKLRVGSPYRAGGKAAGCEYESGARADHARQGILCVREQPCSSGRGACPSLPPFRSSS